MKRLLILISGRGSNMLALLEACAARGWPAQVVGVLADRPEAGGLALAAARGVPTVVVDHRMAGSRAAFDEALRAQVAALKPDLVLLAGFMRILDAGFVAAWSGRLLNVHPSLLPAFPGLHTHRRALAEGCRVAGATVHLVTAELDHGAIVAQSAVPVLEDDDERALGARVLATEHRLYPLAVEGWLRGQWRTDAEGRVRWAAGARPLDALALGGEPCALAPATVEEDHVVT